VAALGAVPAEAPQRLTFMVAFWADDPRATPFPPSSGQASAPLWPRDFTAPLFPSTGEEQDGSGGSGDRDRSAAADAMADLEWTAVLNPRAVRAVAPVWEALEADTTSGPPPAPPTKGERGLDLLSSRCFTEFAALSSGVLFAGARAACSLNCGGTCVACLSRHAGKAASGPAP
jgi:hypothetical protein